MSHKKEAFGYPTPKSKLKPKSETEHKAQTGRAESYEHQSSPSWRKGLAIGVVGLTIIIGGKAASDAVSQNKPYPNTTQTHSVETSTPIPEVIPVVFSVIKEGFNQTWSPDGRMMAYQRANGSIWIANIDGTDKKQIVSSGASTPIWSPDGKLIYFNGGFSDKCHLCAYDVDKKEVVKVAPAYSFDTFSMSADGRHLNTSGYYGGTNLVGDNNKFKEDGDLGDFNRPIMWSPDGKHILYSDRYYPDWYSAEDSGQNEVKVIEGGSYPTWSPDGKKIAYTYWDNSKDTIVIYSLESGTRKAYLSEGDIHHLAWSPDGKWIAYFSGTNLYIFNPDTGKKYYATSVDPRASKLFGVNEILQPIWSPDGEYISFSYGYEGTWDKSLWGDIYTVKLNRR